FFFSSRRRHTISKRDWSSDVCSSDLDEAGQALPQASVGAIFRSKRVLAVGDPSQIKPVMVLDSELLTIVSEYYNIDESFLSTDASTQSLIDAASEYGYKKNE